jgi:hypothetical protein
MFGSQVLEVVVGLLMFYLLLSLACTGATGAVLALLFVKERNMARGMRHVLGVSKDPELTRRLFEHPLVNSLEGRPTWLAVGVRRPTPLEISPEVFRQALPEAIAGDTPLESSGWEARFREAVERLPADDGLRRLMMALAADTDGGSQLRVVVEKWYREAVEAVKERYRRSARTLALVTAALTVTMVNADSLMMYEVMGADVALRSALVRAADASVEAGKTAEDAIAAVAASSADVTVPLGWESASSDGLRAVPSTLAGWIKKIVGLAISAFAASLGATFWFDMIKKVASVRAIARATAPTQDP